jgi:hypothetical protein
MWWVISIVAIIATITVILLPLSFGISFRYEKGKGEFRVIVVFAHLIHWRVVVPMRFLHLGSKGIQAKVRTGFAPEKGGKVLKETITLKKLFEERLASESKLHLFLTSVDLLQVLFLGKDPSDGRDRSIGSPLLHLVGGPVAAFFGSICKLDFTWKTRFGTGDAVSTALGIGGLWSVKSLFGALLEKRYKMLHPPDVQVTPDYDAIAFDTEIRCIFHLTIGQIMWRAVRDAAQRWQGKGAGSFGG